MREAVKANDGYFAAMHGALWGGGTFLYVPRDVTVELPLHAATWAAPSVRDLFDRHVPRWREDNQSLRYITYTPLAEIEDAHRDAKRALLSYVESANGVKLDENHFTLGFARRATAYKRADLLFADIDRLNRIASDIGPIQIIYAGKAHPRDSRGKEIIRSIVAARASLSENVQLIMVVVASR